MPPSECDVRMMTSYSLPSSHPLHTRTADSSLIRAAQGLPGPRPVWFMRQAGRSLPEYRAIRADVGMLEACFTPELAAEITLQPVRRHGVDAAIFFSDIVVPIKAIGLGIDIVAGTGPVVEEPIRTRADVDRLRQLEPTDISAIAEAVSLTVAELGDRPLIGFAGAPFTVASYLIEGGPSRDHLRTKAMMHTEPSTWHDLAGRLADIAATFLREQILAGASAVQLFDSWAGALNRRDYEEFVLPHTQRVFERVLELGVPRFHFGVGTGELLSSMALPQVDVLGVDYRVDLLDAAAGLDRPMPLQGNLDPAMLFASWPVLSAEIDRILRQGDKLPGHIFNLGHGVVPSADPDVITRVVDYVHQQRPSAPTAHPKLGTSVAQ